MKQILIFLLSVSFISCLHPNLLFAQQEENDEGVTVLRFDETSDDQDTQLQEKESPNTKLDTPSITKQEKEKKSQNTKLDTPSITKQEKNDSNSKVNNSSINNQNPLQEEPNFNPTESRSRDKIGINIKGFLGIGFSSVEVEGIYKSLSYSSKFSIPQIILGASYQFMKNIPLEFGAFLHYNKYNFKIKDKESCKDVKIDISMTKLGLETLYKFNISNELITPYVAIDLFPYVRRSVNNHSKTFLAVSLNGGSKFSINDSLDLFAQLSLEHLLETDGVSHNNINLLFGVGTSL